MPGETSNPFIVISHSSNNASNKAAMIDDLFVVTKRAINVRCKISIFVYKIPSMCVIGIAIKIIVKPIPWYFASIGPYIFFKVRVIYRKTCIDNCHDYIVVTYGGIPCRECIDTAKVPLL